MPKSRIMIQLDKDFIKRIDKERGDVPRAAWIRRVLEERMDGAGRIHAAAREATAEAIRDIRAAERPETIIRNMRDGTQASVAQAEPSVGEDAGSRPARRAGKGSGQRRALAGGKQADKPLQPIASGSHSPTHRPESPSRPIKKGKACKHTNQIRKLGAAFCSDCGEFV